jgi:hypothetical protein
MASRTFDPTMAGYRVTLRADGRTGVLRLCHSRRTGDDYWRVHLDDGQWVWPNDLVCTSRGRYELRCGECALDYRTDEPNAHLCPNCVRAIEQAHGADDPDRRPAHHFNWRRRR